MTRTKSTFLALLVVLLSPMAANADVIQFEGIAPDGFELRWDNAGISTYTEAGFDITTNDNFQAFFESGTYGANGLSGASGDALFYQNVTTLFTITETGGGLFGLASLDAGGLFSGSGSVQVTGYLSGGGTVQTLLDLVNFSVTAGVLPTFTFDGAWNDLTAVDLLRTSGNFIAFDNITLTRSVSVPEPGTLALLGIGLFGMGLSRRRRKT